MKTPNYEMRYEAPADFEVLEAYLNKTDRYNRNNAKKIRRALYKLSKTSY